MLKEKINNKLKVLAKEIGVEDYAFITLDESDGATTTWLKAKKDAAPLIMAALMINVSNKTGKSLEDLCREVCTAATCIKRG